MKQLQISEIDKWILDSYTVYHSGKNGYFRLRIGKTYIYLHRFILNAKKGDIIDHVNRDRFDNRRENLRIASASLNCYNRDVNNNLGRGIYFDKCGNRYRACISVKNKTLKLGSSKDINKVKMLYNAKAFELYGADAFQHLIE
jgi:hypothetical protein